MAVIPKHIYGVGGLTGKFEYSGMDSEDLCSDRDYFRQYPWPIEYSYNSRGFRDHEWSDNFDQLKNSIWCVGDSFTVGVGSPFSHTWPQVLKQLTDRSVINCGMDGASNDWISDTALKILDAFDPDNLVIMWSYTHRRAGSPQGAKIAKYDTVPQWKITYDKIRDVLWPRCNTVSEFQNLPTEIRRQVLDQIGRKQFQKDLNLRLHYVKATEEDDIENLKQCIDRVRYRQRKRIIHASIPHFVPQHCQTQGRAVIECQPHWIPHFEKLDRARDGHHFDIKTSQWVAKQIQPLLLPARY